MAGRKKRRETFGQLDNLPSGRHRARDTVPDRGRYAAPRTFDNLTDARAWLAARHTEVATRVWRSPSIVAAEQAEQAERSLSFARYAESWLSSRANAKGDHLRPRTVDEYKRLLRTPDPASPGDAGGPLADLLPLIVGAITPARVREWRSGQLATDRKTQTSRAYGLLNTIMTTAVQDGIATTKPCTIKGGQATNTGRKAVPPTDTELDTILDSIRALPRPSGRRRCRWPALRRGDRTAGQGCHGGARRGRASQRCAPERGARSGAHYRGHRGRKHQERGARRVGIFGPDAEILAEHVLRLIGDALLFPADDGVSYVAQSTFWKHWSPARTAAGRADMPFHALRHYAGTRYAQAGATPSETMARLGRSSLAAAMRYQHAGTTSLRHAWDAAQPRHR